MRILINLHINSTEQVYNPGTKNFSLNFVEIKKKLAIRTFTV